MALVKGICPNCNKEIKVEENDFNVICTFCGVPFFPHEAVNLYNKKINDMLDNVVVDTLDVTADSIANYATLGLTSLKEKNHEKCGFYADDILKRNSNSPEGLLLKAFFISNNYSKEEGIFYYVEAYKNCVESELRKLILDTFKEEFNDYSIENFRYFISNVLVEKKIDDIDFVKYALTFLSTSVGKSLYDELNVSKDLLSIYFNLETMKRSKVEAYDVFYNDEVLIFINGDTVKLVVDKNLVDKDVERFAHNKGEDTRNYYFYLGEKGVISIELQSLNETFEAIINEMGLHLLEGKSGCYIATCVYGSYYHPNVRILRNYRDETLMNNFLGRLFVKIYYFISPGLVKIFGNFNWFKSLNKNILDIFSNTLKENGYTSDYIRDRK